MAGVIEFLNLAEDDSYVVVNVWNFSDMNFLTLSAYIKLQTMVVVKCYRRAEVALSHIYLIPW